jgi:hypothetical protein
MTTGNSHEGSAVAKLIAGIAVCLMVTIGAVAKLAAQLVTLMELADTRR